MVVGVGDVAVQVAVQAGVAGEVNRANAGRPAFREDRAVQPFDVSVGLRAHKIKKKKKEQIKKKQEKTF